MTFAQYFSFDWRLGSNWPIAVIPLLLTFCAAFFAPLRRYRLEYFAFLSLLSVVFVGTMWLRNLHSEERLVLSHRSLQREDRGWGLTASFSGNGFSLMFEDTLAGIRPTPHINWSGNIHPRRSEYPTLWLIGPHPWHWKQWGFAIVHSDNMSAPIPNKVWQVVMPNWFLMLAFSVLPMYCLRVLPKRRHLRNARRWGLCENPDCRYDLRGTVRCGDGARWCPECNHRNPPAAGWKRGDDETAANTNPPVENRVTESELHAGRMSAQPRGRRSEACSELS